MSTIEGDHLAAPHSVSFPYRRSVGGAERVFLEGLRHQEIRGSVAADGSVTVPPVEWDPETGVQAAGFVPVGDEGTVRSWTWVAEPAEGHPLDRPFAFALVQMDGADSALLHVVDAGAESRMRTGMAVRAEWRDRRSASILDIRAFVPVDAGEPPGGPATPEPPGEGSVAGHADTGDADTGDTDTGDTDTGDTDIEVASDVNLGYTYEPGVALSSFFRALTERRIEGGRCPSCSRVYVPPRSRCPACHGGPMRPVEMGNRGVVDSYSVVHLPTYGLDVEVPFVCAWVRLDGADVPFTHLVGAIGAEEIRVGQRVEAVWAAGPDLAPGWEAIAYFRPVVEPPSGREPGRDPLR